MGGSNSGRYGGRATLEAALKLDIGTLMRGGLIRPGVNSDGALSWKNATTDETIATIAYKTSMEADRGRLRLLYATTHHATGEKDRWDYELELTTTAQPFGGRRWWFICPKRGDLAAMLYKPSR